MATRLRAVAALFPALGLGACAVTAGGFATDFQTMRTAGVTVGSDAPPATAWANCAALPGPGGATRAGPVRTGMSECEVVAVLGPPVEAFDAAEPDGTLARHLVWAEAAAPRGERTYIFLRGRLARIEG